MTNMSRAKKIVDDVVFVLRDTDSANSRVLAEALGNVCKLLEAEIIGNETKASDYNRIGSRCREYPNKDGLYHDDEDFIDELIKV